MNDVVLIVLLAGAAARVTRLLVADSFPPIQAAREWLLDRYPEDSWQSYLATCPWCLGVWVAGLITLAVDLRYGLPAPLLVWATAAHAAGWLVANEDHEPEPEQPEPTGRRPYPPSEV